LRRLALTSQRSTLEGLSASHTHEPALARSPHPILVIEDDREIREALADVLHGEGYEVKCAVDAREAWAGLQGGWDKPSLIILDLWLPGMHGLEFRAIQLATPETADIPVVVVTAGGVAPQEAAALGLSYVLRKPLDIELFLRVVRRLSSWSGDKRPALSSS
jgi:CheY-like chemotaxis protein